MADENIMSLIQNLLLDDTSYLNGGSLEQQINSSSFYSDNLLAGLAKHSNVFPGKELKSISTSKCSPINGSSQQSMVLSALQQNKQPPIGPPVSSTSNTGSQYSNGYMGQFGYSQESDLLDMNGTSSSAFFGKNSYTRMSNGKPFEVDKKGGDLSSKELPLSPISECSLNSLIGSQSILKGHGANSNPLLAFNTLSMPSTGNSFGNLSSTWQQGTQQPQLPISSLSSNNFADLLMRCEESTTSNQYTNAAYNMTMGKSVASQNQVNAMASAFGNAVCHSSTVSSQPTASSPSPDSFVYTDEDRFESQMRSLANEIHSTIQLHMNGLHMRREALLQQLEHIKNIYRDVLRKQKNRSSNGMTNGSLLNGSKGHMLSSSCAKVDSGKLPLPCISFTKPDTTLYKAISSLGHLNTPAFAPFCTASGDGLEFAVPGVNCSFSIDTRNCFNDELHMGREHIQVEILALFTDAKLEQGSPLTGSPGSCSLNGSPNSRGSACGSRRPSLLEYTSKSVVPHTFFDHKNGKYSVTYVIPPLQHLPKELVISIAVNGLAINDSPLRVPVQMQKCQNWKRVCTFGSEGNSIGELCRPWGVAVVRMPAQLLASTSSIQNGGNPGSPNGGEIGSIGNGSHMKNSPLIATQPQNAQTINNHYLIGVADRSNNRIQMLDYDCGSQQINVINVFGSGPGNRPGMFDRPAGICINLGLGYIIVADKDNHRIQVFNLTGRYLFKFGEKGSRAGQFCYPWDIDCCAQSHQIVVSDTRNRRIQLFTPYGQYITHFALLLDSPRGVAFLPDKRLVVSDFNKHRILIFDKIGGKESSSPTVIPLPNGAPGGGSMNNQNGEPIGFSNLGSPKIIGFGEGSKWGEFLRPQGIAVNGNSIFCADSRNNRICVYNMLTQTFEYLSENLELDRPSDLAVVDDNMLVLVDFGHNRLQILQR